MYLNKTFKGGIIMPKDSQPDNKEARMRKCNNQTPITSEEGKNHNKTTKKHSIKKEGTQSAHIN